MITLGTLFIVANFLIVYYANAGALPVAINLVTDPGAATNNLSTLDFTFYAKVYMQSYFHLPSYFIGFIGALVFRSYLINSELSKN